MLISTSTPSSRSAPMSAEWKSATERGRSSTTRSGPSLWRTTTRCATKSNCTSKLASPWGMGPVPSPRAVRPKATSHHWLRKGHSSSFSLPTTCVNM